MDDVQAKLDQEETKKVDQSEQGKVNNTEEDNAAAEVVINIAGQNNNIKNDEVGDDDDINGDVWELEDINAMQMATEFSGGYYNVRGGWGEWKHDGGETWREWEFYPTNYQENDWVIDDLWVFEDHHQHPNQANNGDASANPRHPQP